MGYLRLTAGAHPTDAQLAGLIGELVMHSQVFAGLWSTGGVADCTTGPMDLSHPDVGRVDVDYQIWLQPDSPDHRLEVYTPRDDSSRKALSLLSAQASC